MKATGIVRKVDELGRIVVPIELRRMLDIEIKDPVEIFVDDGAIVLKKYESEMTCAVTGEVDYDNMQFADGKIILSEEGAQQLMNEIKEYLG